MNDKEILSKFLQMSLEDVSGEVVNKVEKEIEHVWFGKINVAELEELAKLPFVTKNLQEQFTVKLDFSKENPDLHSIIRARRVNREGAVFTNKVRKDGQVGNIERSVEVSNEVFDFLSQVIGTGIMKMRYTIKPEGYDRKLELDVFLDATGHYPGDGTYAYAKYDFEVLTEEERIPPLPIELVDQQYLNPFSKEAAAVAVNLRAFMTAQSYRI